QKGSGPPTWNCHQFHSHSEFFADYGVYEVEIDVPEAFVVGATGRLQGPPAASGDAKRLSYSYRQEDVHDFAWCASPHFVERNERWEFDRFCNEAPDGMGERLRRVLAEAAGQRGVAPDSIRPTPVDVRFLLQPDHAEPEVWERYKWSVGAAIACYGIWYGRYPYDVLTVVDPPDGGRDAGGMEYPTLITCGARRLAPSYAWGQEGVTIHEFGHQFFYGLLGNNEFEEAWLDEGINSFSDARTTEAAYGPGTAGTRYGHLFTAYHRPFEAPRVFERISSLLRVPTWTGWLKSPWKKDEPFLSVPERLGLFSYVRDLPFLHYDRHVTIPQPWGERSWVLDQRSDDSMVRPSWEYAGDGDYWVNSYGKPTVFLYALRGLMGARAFDRMMYAYAERHRFGHPRTKDFTDTVARFAAEAPDGGDPRLPELVGDFTRAVLETGARLDVAVLSASSRKVEGKKAVWEWTARVQRRGQIPVPVEVVATDATGDVHRWLWIAAPGETTRTFRTRRNRALRSVRVGPPWIAWLDGDVTNNARLVDDAGDRRPAAVLTARWTLSAEEILRTYVGVDR
ncbi:MAG: hypothetical protein ACE5JG_01370, partial [Planctomycetota bacterium]